MKTKVVLAASQFDYEPGDILVGVETGALAIINQDLPLSLALGDFDSVSAADFQRIKVKAEKLIRLNPIKDVSDSEAVVKYLVENNYPEIYLYGALGKRFDHSWVNFLLVSKYGITLIDNYNKIFALSAGKYQVFKDNYQYLSLFTLTKATIALDQVKYPLPPTELDVFTTYTLSNEIINASAKIEVLAGQVMVILSQD